MKIVVATRKSALALAQTRAFVAQLRSKNPGLEVEELQVVTTGDRIQDRPLNEVGGKGLFVKEIEEALLDKRADIAVHSMKDLPAEQPRGLAIACVPERADPRDVLLVRDGEPSLSSLPPNARIGSSSLRRRIAILRHRGDAIIDPLRGNIDTRMRKLAEGQHDAIVLAAAGLSRLGVEISLPHRPFDVEEMLPAVAQGILAIEARADDERVHQILLPMEHEPSRLRACAERGVLRALGADCTVPLAAHSTLQGDQMRLEAWLTETDGTQFRTASENARVDNREAAEQLGLSIGRQLLGTRRDE
jgi:hydroxymethylbilane synthase